MRIALAGLLLVLPFVAGCTAGTIPITENHSGLGTGGQTAREIPAGSMRQTPGADAPAMTASAGSGRVGLTAGHGSAAVGNFNGGPTGSAGHATGGSGGSGHGGGSAGAGH